jgi:hypothetical protein
LQHRLGFLTPQFREASVELRPQAGVEGHGEPHLLIHPLERVQGFIRQAPRRKGRRGHTQRHDQHRQARDQGARRPTRQQPLAE